MWFCKLQGTTRQPSFSQAEFVDKKKITRREKFFARMEALIPWTNLLAVIEPFYPKCESPHSSAQQLQLHLFSRCQGRPQITVFSRQCKD